MDYTILFATPVGVTKHPALAAKAEELFEHKELFTVIKDQDTGLFWTTLREYDSKEPPKMPDSPVVEEIKEAIVDGARAFMAGFGYAVDKYDFEVTRLWMNRMRSDAFHTVHSHYGSTCSGCFYVKAPKGSGSVEFYSQMPEGYRKSLEVQDYNIFSARSYKLEVEAGDMVFWESYLRHGVPASAFEGTRLSMAFDINVTYKD